MPKELWKDIKRYEGLYQVSNMRRVKSLNYGRSGREGILKQCKDTQGYLLVYLHKDGERKNCRIHRLVAQAFIPNPEGLPQINHIDEIKANNCVDNLEWCDNLYNCNYGTRNEKDSKSKSKPVKCLETGEIFSSGVEAQKKTGIGASHITACARRDKHYHTARRLHWEYVKKGEIK